MVSENELMTDLQSKSYLKNPTHCPYCDSGNISGEFVDVDSGYTDQRVCCEKCGRIWMEIYKLIEVEDYV